MSFSLTELCACYVAKHSSLLDLCKILSYELPENSSGLIFSYLPLNRALSFEKHYKHCCNVTTFWKLVIEKCMVRNYAFQAKLKTSLDIFELDEFEQRNQTLVLDHEKQVLFNCLFQEALDKIYYWTIEKDRALPSFKLHEALQHNYPDVSEMEWLLLLSEIANCFNFYPKHAEMIFKNKTLLQNITNHIQYVDLKLNITLDKDRSIYRHFYTVLHQMLCGSVLNRVSFNKPNATANFMELLRLCVGKVNTKVVCKESDFEKPGLEANTSACEHDIWDDALGSSSFEVMEGTQAASLYSDFDMESIEENSDMNCIKTNAVSALELDLEAIALKDEFINTLSKAYSLTEIAFNLVQISLDDGIKMSIMPLIIFDCVDSLLSNRHSNLHTIKLGNFELSSVKLSEISMSLCMLYEKRKYPFKKLAFVNCRFTDEMHGSFYEYSSNDETIVEVLYIDKVVFENHKAYTNYTDCCVHSLNPLTYCVIGSSCYKTSSLSLNIDLLYDAFQSISPHKLSSIKTVIFTLPLIELPPELEQKIECAFSHRHIRKFVLLHDFKSVLPERLLMKLKQHIDSIVLKEKSLFEFTNPNYSKEDYVSQM